MSATGFSSLNPLAALAGFFSPLDEKETETSRLLNETKIELAKLQEEIYLKKEKLEEEKELRSGLEMKYQSEIAVLSGELEVLTQLVDNFNRQMAQLAIVPDLQQEIAGKTCLININTASKDDLQKLTGIGPVLAQRIIEARPFLSVNELINVSGIGETILQKIIEQGCAHVDEVDGEGEDEEIFEEEEAEKATAICPININTASKEELQAITGVGPVLAQRMIEARPFYSLSDLIMVSGIGQTTLDKIIAQDCAYASGYAGGSGSTVSSTKPPAEPKPEISLVYPEENPVNKEIEVIFSASNLKNASYDIKISIEKDGVLSQIYNEEKEGENKWQTSLYYLTEVFSGTSFEGNFRLKIREDKEDFRGQADIIARIRETGKTGFLEFKGKINITDPEEKSAVEYNLTIDIIGEGSTDPVIGTYIYKENEEVIVTAFPDEDWKFIGWDGSVMSEETMITIIMDEDKLVTAIFEEEQDEPEPPQNLLLNEFFEDGWEGTSAVGNPVNWSWGKRGGLELEDPPLVDGKISFYHEPYSSYYDLTQIGKTLEIGKTYYAEIWLKGTGKVKLGIDHSDTTSWLSPGYTEFNNAPWTKINYSVAATADTNDGGVRIRMIRFLTTGEKLALGAAWLGTVPPPDNWLDKN